MELPIWFRVIDFTYWTGFIKVDLGSKRHKIADIVSWFLKFPDRKNIVEGNTKDVNEHEEWNILV